MDRRTAIISGGAFLAAGGPALARTAPDPLSGAALMADVRDYVDFGIHHAGGAADRRTTAWMAAHWKKLGYAIERQAFEVPNSDTTAARLELGRQALEGFAQPPIAFTPRGGLSALLVRWAPGADVRGKIVLATTAQGVTAARAAGAAAVVLTAATPSGEVVANNTQPDAKPDIPLLFLAQRHQARLEAAAGTPARLRIEGRGGVRTAHNTIATSG